MQPEIWKKIKLPSPNATNLKLEVSNLGKIKSIATNGKETVLKGSMINGYRILKFSLFNEREEKVSNKIERIKKKIISLQKTLKTATENKFPKAEIKQIATEISEQKSLLNTTSETDIKDRRNYNHFLFHRMVAKYFLPKPTKDQVFVGHLDYNKLNNEATNLIFMTKAESIAHQQKSPYVIASKEKRKSLAYIQNSSVSVLTISGVKQIKKLLLKNKTKSSIAKKFGVSETQINRISKGENWKTVTI